MVKSLLNTSRRFFSRENTNILSAAVIIGAAYLASAGIGLVRDRLLAAHFFGGLESQLDAYFAAFVVPDTLFQLVVVGALSVAFIPVYTQYLKKGDEEANHLINASLNSIFAILLGLTVIIFIFAEPFSRLITHFPEDKVILMANIMRIMLVGQLFFTISAFMSAILQTHRRFIVPAIAPLMYNLGTILGIIFLVPIFGIYGAAIGITLGAFLHLLVQLPLAIKLGYQYKLIFDNKHAGVRTIRRLMVPRTMALAIIQLEDWIAVFFGSLFAAGSLSLLNFSRQLYSLPISLFGVSLGQAAFPTLSSEASEDQLTSFKTTLGGTILQILFFSLPASVLLLVLRVPVVRLAFGAKNFPWDATLTTGLMVAILSISIAPQAISHVLVRSFHALHDSKTPFYISIATVVVNLILTALFTIVVKWNILGITLAVTVANTLGGILLMIFIERKIGSLSIMRDIAKIISVTVITGIFLWVPMRILDQYVFDTTHTIALILLSIVTTVVGLSVYLLLSRLFRVHQLESVTAIMTKIGNWRQILGESDEIIEAQGTDLHA